jgi:two-component system chemotaxis response regulator CheB
MTIWGKAEPCQERYRWNGAIVAIAASTGGVEAIERILAEFPPDCPPTLIVQHMRGGITPLFADRLDRHVLPRVVEARDAMPVLQGQVYIAPADDHHLTIVAGRPPLCRLSEGPLVNGHRPSADVLFRSLARCDGARIVGVILTGMGDDGAKGLLNLRQKGMHTIGQDESSALIYGMPKAAADLGAVEQALPLGRIAGRILKLCQC